MCETHFCNWPYFKVLSVSNIPQGKENSHYVVRLGILLNYQTMSLLIFFFFPQNISPQACPHA